MDVLILLQNLLAFVLRLSLWGGAAFVVACLMARSVRWGTQLNLWRLPQDVSFKGIALQEIPSDYADPKGYFANEAFREIWSHTRARGAGHWHNVAADNYFMTDGANLGDELPRMTSAGVLTNDPTCGWIKGTMNWKIPVGWNERNSDNDDDFVVKTFQTYWQQFMIDERGTAYVSKLGWKAWRGTNNVSRIKEGR